MENLTKSYEFLTGDSQKWLSGNSPVNIAAVLNLGIGMYQREQHVDLSPVLDCIGDLKNAMGQIHLKSEKSITRGMQGEGYVKEILGKYRITDTHKLGKMGDMVVNERLMVEVKDYTNTVPKTEVDKFLRDLESGGFACGLFISLSSGVSGMAKLHHCKQMLGGLQIPVIYICSDSPVVIQLATELLLTETLDKSSCGYMQFNEELQERIITNLSQIIVELNSISQIRRQLSEFSRNTQCSLNCIYESLISFEVRIRELAQFTQYDLDLLVDDVKEYDTDCSVDMLVSKYGIKHHTDCIGGILSKVKVGQWKFYKSKITHSTGIGIIFNKVNTQFIMDYTHMCGDKLQGILTLYKEFVKLQNGVLQITINTATVAVIMELLQ